jgi:MYXO-CTERM domain-containing protein
MRSILRTCFVFLIFLVATFATLPAHAAGSVKLKSAEVSEVSGGWRLFVTIELTKPPATAHVPLKFLFTKTMVYERSLVDGKTEPVLSKQSLTGQTPSIESLDVDFADGSGKVFKGTRFDFMLTRQRGYEAGEYKLQVRTADGTDVGTSQLVVLKGDNEPVDRRSIAFNPKDPKIKKVDTGVDGGAPAKGGNDTTTAANTGNGDVAPVGTGEAFIPKEAYQPTEEENIKVRPKGGCGCAATQDGLWGQAGVGVMALVVAVALARQRRAARDSRSTRA